MTQAGCWAGRSSICARSRCSQGLVCVHWAHSTRDGDVTKGRKRRGPARTGEETAKVTREISWRQKQRRYRHRQTDSKKAEGDRGGRIKLNNGGKQGGMSRSHLPGLPTPPSSEGQAWPSQHPTSELPASHMPATPYPAARPSGLCQVGVSDCASHGSPLIAHIVKGRDPGSLC